MRVLIVVPSALLGGAERVAFSFADHLLSLGCEVTVLAMTRGPGRLWPLLADRPGFRLFARNVRSEKEALLWLPADLVALRRRGAYDLIYTTHVHINALVSLCLRLGVLRTRYLISRESTRIFERFHGLNLFVYRTLYRLYGRQDLLILQTEDMRDSLLGAITLPSRVKPVVLPNPVNLAAIDRQAAEPVETGQIGASSAIFELVFCGRLIPLKRVGLLLGALASLERNDWRLTVLGEGPSRGALESQRDRLGLGEMVRFLGNVNNPYAFFARADLGVLVSEVEGFPNVVLEMMASGTKSLIVTPCTQGIRELPGVQILEQPTVDELAGMIANAIASRENRSALYRCHIEEERGIERFARAIFYHLGLDPPLLKDSSSSDPPASHPGRAPI